LIQIQKEFQNIFELHYSTMFANWRSSWLYPIDRAVVLAQAPSYVGWLKEIKLYDRWSNSVFSTTYGSEGNNQTIHTDNVDCNKRCFALNIPILNCHDSWTVWYKTKENSGIAGHIPHYPMATGFSDEDAGDELGRMPASQPAFVNVGIPHRPWADHEEPRIVLSTRFDPEIFDYLS
jgi:hypothetical protein